MRDEGMNEAQVDHIKAAYGAHDKLSCSRIVRRLLARDLERMAAVGMWLRPTIS